MLRRLLVANRGEIALRVLRACSENNVKTVALATAGDETSLHIASADEAVQVPSYMDSAAVIEAAMQTGCDAIHPGYGFLSESADFARRCEKVGISFVGPSSDTLSLLGDKVEARKLAQSLGVPVAAGSDVPCDSVASVRSAIAERKLNFPLFLKAVGGGGGRGIRPVPSEAQLDDAFAACAREAAAVGLEGGVFVEEMVEGARHIEVQLLGDGEGNLVHLYERDCSVQRRRQKVIEIAPAPFLDEGIRGLLTSNALAIGNACGYRGAGTCEFLLPARRGAPPIFLEFNPRIQVEHTVTEEATGVDLVAAQLQIAAGASLGSLGLRQQQIRLVGSAMQARVQMAAPGGRVGAAYTEPGGLGIRVDSALYSGYEPNASFDPLLLKIIARAGVGAGAAASGEMGASDAPMGGAWEVARRRLLRACGELHLGGELQTNMAEVCAVLESPAFARGEWTTATLDETDGTAATAPPPPAPTLSRARLFAQGLGSGRGEGGDDAAVAAPSTAAGDGALPPAPEGCVYVVSPLQGQVLDASEAAESGDALAAGGCVLVLASMKMEHVVPAPTRGVLVELLAAPGQHVRRGEPIALLRCDGADEVAAEAAPAGEAVPEERADLAKVLAARRATTDDGRVEAGDAKFAERRAMRHARGQLTARENVAALLDEGAELFEYGRYAVAAQRGRASIDELMKRSPADGLITGVGTVNGGAFGAAAAKAAVAAYDATVLAGTQGFWNHMKLDRIIEVAGAQSLPLVLFAEGGGGRPGDTDVEPIANSQLGVHTFSRLAALSGSVPLVGLASGYCFAGNAALLGACDVVIATRGANIGMAGPAMIEGGGLGRVLPTQIGPSEEGSAIGVVDVLVADETEAVDVARRYLAYFQGRAPACAESGGWAAADQSALRHVVPQNRKRTYDMRRIITTVCDADSWLELRSGFAEGIISGLCRVEGHALGVVANRPDGPLGGAVDSDGALKAARFMELCDAFDIPLLFLCDTPGFMVGVEHEQTAAVRKLSRMFAVGASLSVPCVSIVTRKSYGLGAMAMMGGHAAGKHNTFHLSWPSAEAGPMNLEGAVALGFAKELGKAHEKGGAAAQQALYEKLLAGGYERGSALSVARTLETDDVIDPSESRRWIAAALETTAPPAQRPWRRKRPCVSPW